MVALRVGNEPGAVHSGPTSQYGQALSLREVLTHTPLAAFSGGRAFIGGNMETEIRVYVCKYRDRDNLVMMYRDPYSGRQVTKSAKTPNHKQAERTAAKWEDDLHNGRYKSPSRVTWEEFRDKYESEVLSGLAKNTEIKVCGILDSVETIINPERVRDVTSDRLSFYVAKQRKAGLAESTLASHVATCGLRWATRSSGAIWPNCRNCHGSNGPRRPR